MKNLSCFKLNNSLKPKRVCYAYIDASPNEEMRNMEAANKKTEEYVHENKLTWDEVNKHVWSLAESASLALKASVIDLKAKVKNQSEITSLVTQKEKDGAIKKHEDAIDKEAVEIQKRINELRDQAIIKLNSYFELRQKEEEEVKQRIYKNLKGKLDPEDLAKIRKEAETIAELGDDRNWISKLWKKRGVQDYLDSEIEEIKDKNGKPTTLKDSEVENITMGILMSLKGTDAEMFVQKLEEREAKNEAMDDQGISVKDIQTQVLDNMGFQIKDETDRTIAQKSPAGKMFLEIAANNDLSPSMKGLLLGELAKIKITKIDYSKTTLEEANRQIGTEIAPVTRMYQMLKDLKMGNKDQVYTFDGLDESLLISQVTTLGAVRGLGGGVWGGVLGGVGGLMSGLYLAADRTGTGDKKSLEQAAVIMMALKKGEKIHKLEETLVSWNEVKRLLAGLKADREQMQALLAKQGEIESLFETLKNNPELIDKQSGTLKTKVEQMKAEVTVLKAKEPKEVLQKDKPAENASALVLRTLESKPNKYLITPASIPTAIINKASDIQAATETKWYELSGNNQKTFFVEVSPNGEKSFHVVGRMAASSRTKAAKPKRK